MPKSTSVTSNFTSGEWSPKSRGRFDLDKYPNGAKKVENFLINQLGGGMFRPGTRFIAETKDSSKESRLIPFQYSATDDYVIEVGDLYMKLYSSSGDAVADTQADPYTKLLMHFNGNDAAKEIRDSGNTGHVLTQVNSATISTADAKFGIGSLLVNGSHQSVTAPTSADFNIGTNWTLDLWVKMNSHTINNVLIAHLEDGSNYWVLTNQHGGNLYFQIDGGTGGDITIGGTAIDDSGWHHIAVIKVGSNWSIYKDGIWLATQNAAVTTAFTGNLAMGGVTGFNYTQAYIDEVRIYNGNPFSADPSTTTAITVPTSAYTSDSDTKLLLHFETQDESSVTAPKIPTFVGDAQLDTAQKESLTGNTYTQASLRLDGTGDYVTIPDSADWDITTGDYTIEAFLMIDDLPGDGIKQTIASQYASATSYWELGILNTGGTYSIYFNFYNGAAKSATVDFVTLNADTFYHIAMVKSGSNYYFFQKGALLGTMQTSAFSVLAVAGVLQIGAYNTTNNPFDGWIDELRISKGLARWTAAFTHTTAVYALEPLIVTSITTTYLEADLFDIHYAQNNDVMYITHPDYTPRKLSRTSATAFDLSVVPFVRGPFMDTNITTTEITADADTGSITLTSSAAIFLATHVGSLWRVDDGVVKITAFTSTTEVDGDVQAEPDGSVGDLNNSATGTKDWAEGAFSGYRGYPATVTFHEQRLIYANTTTEPQKFWCSAIGAYDNFDVGSAGDDDACTFEVASEQRSAILWMLSGVKALQLGTLGGVVSGVGGNTEPIAAGNPPVLSRDTNYGVSNLLPKRISSFIYYIQRDDNKLREISYNFNADAHVANDMTLFAEHVLSDGDGIVDLDHQQAPNDRLYCVRSDGQMAVLTRNPEQDVMGWSRFVAGADAVGDGKFESVCVTPKASANDQVWAIVNRTINGSTKRFIEFFLPEQFDEDWDAVRVDSSLTLDNPKTITGATAADPVVITAVAHGFTDGDYVKINGILGMTELNGNEYKVANKADDTFELTDSDDADIDGSAYTAYKSAGEVRKGVTNISGLTHLDTETVSAQVDGYIPSTETYTVAGGAITLSARAYVVHVGLPYTGTIQLMKKSDGSAVGTGQTKVRRTYLSAIRVDRTQGLSIGRSSDTLDEIAYDETSLFTGDIEKFFQTSWGKGDEIIIKQTKALPADILAVILSNSVEEN